MNFKKRDYVILFFLSAIIYGINLIGPLTIGKISKVLLTSIITSLFLGTITNIIRSFINIAAKK